MGFNVDAHILADEFIKITGDMESLKRYNRRRRAELAEKYAADLAALLEQERVLSEQRAQVALRMTRTGHSMAALGRMVGVSGPFICQLAGKARREVSDETSTENGC